MSVAPTSIAGADPVFRIHRLLHPADTNDNKSLEWVYGLALLGWSSFLIFSHHGIETFLGFIIGA